MQVHFVNKTDLFNYLIASILEQYLCKHLYCLAYNLYVIFQTDLASANNQFENIESKYSTAEKQCKDLKQQLADVQVCVAYL